MTTPDATGLHQQGRDAGSRGNFGEALRLFTQAIALAPNSPYPLYDRAFTHLQLGDFDAARRDYRDVLRLAPRGFFTVHVALDALAREERGELPHGFYLAFSSLESLSMDERRQVVPSLVEQWPGFAPAWLEFAKLAATPEERLARIDTGLRAAPDPETRGMLRLNQALTLRAQAREAEATAILEELVANPQSTLAVETWARTLLSGGTSENR